jgi:glycosyltransferase involved in cell wall biosynthesis
MAGASVSAVIPAYNAAGYLNRAVESVLSQTHPAVEVLVIDDGSSDNTYAVASSLPAPVRAIRKANGGPAAARNMGAREAKGEWIAFLDADDAWLPGKIERQLALASPDVDLVHCLYKASLRPPDTITFQDLWEQNYIATSTVLIRRSAFWAAGGFDEDREIVGVEDYNLWLRLAARSGRMVTLQEQLVSYTPASGSLTQQVERFARAELKSLEKVAADLQLDSAFVAARRARLLDQYGRDLLYFRQMRSARQYLRQALRQGFTLPRLAWWSASLAPRSIWMAWSRVRGQSHV